MGTGKAAPMPVVLLQALSGHQPLVFLHAVQRDEGQKDGDGLHILLIFGIPAIVLILADLQPAGAAEHDENDTGISGQGQRPLSDAGQTSDTGDHTAGRGQAV